MTGRDSSTVLIVADHELACEAIRRELRDASACTVVGCVDAGSSCTAAVVSAQPDLVVVTEFEDPGETLARIREAAGAGTGASIVLLTDRMDSRWLAEVGAAGVDAAIARTIHTDSLVAFLREVTVGNAFHTFESRPRGGVTRASETVAREPLQLVATRRNGAPRHPTTPRRTHVNRSPSSRTTTRLAGRAA